MNYDETEKVAGMHAPYGSYTQEEIADSYSKMPDRSLLLVSALLTNELVKRGFIDPRTFEAAFGASEAGQRAQAQFESKMPSDMREGGGGNS